MANKIDSSNIKSLPVVFKDQPEITPRDCDRLFPNMSNAGILNELFVLGPVSEDDIKRMIVIETATFQREPILDRLIARLASQTRDTTKEVVKYICSKKK